MKKTGFLLLGVLSAGMAMAQEKPFTIQGDVSKVPYSVSKVYLSYRVSGDSKVDSVVVKDGKYSFAGKLTEPVSARVYLLTDTVVRGKNYSISLAKNTKTIFIEPATIKIKHVDSFSNISVSGSKSFTAYQKLEELQKPFNEQMAQLNKDAAAANGKGEEGMKEIRARYDAIQANIKKTYKEYVEKNASSPVAVYALGQFAGYEIKPDEVEPVYNLLPATTRELTAAKELHNRIEIAKKIGIGQYAMDFTQNDTLGNPVSLSSFKGKYVLVDFWASWCGPCRAENPNVVKAYNKYKGKGFDILGVSLDQPNAKDKWLEAIHKDGLTWTHVSDLKYWKNAVALQYDVRGIPFNLLLDPQGKIIGRSLRGEELDKKLAEALGATN
ncbi:MAG: TlpA disulfide reductase family protein [Chitinophagaceae bacterium]